MLTDLQLKEILEHYVAGWTIIAMHAPTYIKQRHVELIDIVQKELVELKKDQEKLQNLSKIITLDS